MLWYAMGCDSNAMLLDYMLRDEIPMLWYSKAILWYSSDKLCYGLCCKLYAWTESKWRGVHTGF